MTIARLRASAWGQTLQLSWAKGALPWWAWSACLALILAALAALGSSWQRSTLEAATLQQELARVSAQPMPAELVVDFARSLGPAPPAAHVVQHLQRACAGAGVSLVSVQASAHAASPERLGRLELAVQLRGGYAGSKQALKQTIERFPGMTVQRLRLRRGASPAEVEAQLTLSLWSAPLVLVEVR